ncbi:MAG: hypothetical protein AB8B56_11195 [Crocinitomicaceae bacterium]
MEQTKHFGNLIAFSMLALATSVFVRITGNDLGYEASLLSLGLVLIFYSLRFRRKEPKRMVDFARYGAVITWSLHAVSVIHGGAFFGWAFIPLLVAGLIWGGLEVRNQFQGNQSIKEHHFLLFAGLAIEMAGMIFKVQHWPGANILLIMGVAIAGAGFVYNTKARIVQKS